MLMTIPHKTLESCTLHSYSISLFSFKVGSIKLHCISTSKFLAHVFLHIIIDTDSERKTFDVLLSCDHCFERTK